MMYRCRSLKTSPRSNGFTLAEVMIAITILFLVTGGLLNLGWQKNEARTTGVAELVEEELRAARQDAIKGNTFVAVVFPSENGGKPHASGYYRLEGLQKPRLTRAIDFSEEYPGSSIFVGYWGLDTSALNDPSAGNTASRAEAQKDWDFPQWQAPFPQDHHIVFGPSGKVYSSSLPRFDNAYHLLVSQGVRYSGATLDGARTFTPSEVLAPSTVTVSLSGYMSTSKGVQSQDGSVQISEALNNPPKPAGVPRVPGPTTTDPEITSVSVFPLPEPNTRPPGVDATVDLRGFLTLQVSARDGDGDRVYCNWTAEKVSGSGTGAGAFSAPLENQMAWEDGEFACTWEWRPPSDALPGDIYQLEVTVTDETGRQVSGELGASGRVEVIGVGQIAYERGGDIWLVNADGTGERNLTNHPAVDFAPTISPDGTKISFFSDRDGTQKPYTMGLDGFNLRKIEIAGLGAQNPHYASWSPRGNELVVSLNETDPGHLNYLHEALFIMSADGSSKSQITPWADFEDVSWHPNRPRIIVSGNSSKDLWEVRIGSGVAQQVTTSGANWEYGVAFSPDGSKVVYSLGPSGVGRPENEPAADYNIWTQDYDPDAATPEDTLTNRTMIKNHGQLDLHPTWSPDGSQIAFASNATGQFEIYIMNADGSNVRQITTGGGRRPDWGRI